MPAGRQPQRDAPAAAAKGGAKGAGKGAGNKPVFDAKALPAKPLMAGKDNMSKASSCQLASGHYLPTDCVPASNASHA